MKKRQIIALSLIIVPPILLMITLAAYAMISFIYASIAQSCSEPSNLDVISSLISVLLGAIGIVSLIGIVAGIPTGIILLVTDRTDKKSIGEQKMEKNTGQDKGLASERGEEN